MQRILNIFLAFSIAFTSSLAVARPTCEPILSRPTLTTAELEAFAVEIMKQVMDHKKNGTDTVTGWLTAIKISAKTHPLTPLEHVTLVFILKSGIFEYYNDPQAFLNLRESIRLSYKHLTGTAITEGDELAPLPAKLLASSSLAATVFHDAIMPATVQSQVRQTFGHFSIFNAVTVLVTAISLCFEPGRYALAGALVGLTQASINEYMVHIGVGHAPKGVAKFFRKFGKIGEFMEEVTLAHKLHHAVVSFNFGAAHLSPEQKIVAEKTLRKLVEALVLDRLKEKYPEMSEPEIKSSALYKERVEYLVDSTRSGNYGVNGTRNGALSMVASASPFIAMNYIIYVLTGSESFLFSSNMVMVTMILQSLYSHYYLHLRPEDEDKVEPSRFQLYYVNHTWLGRLARRLHFTHHEMPFSSDRTKNGVIMAGSMLDRLKGDLQMPRVEDLIKMFQEGYLVEE